ncbi:hypothetical protein JTE90_025064 [Oedothorax gibbosus]|uniref:Uncharacterized protein n=1 Tax=Oedothorax gibbosus TaxID=931172 RepID=A0AAV6TTF5_9ARAC|nr:hypothetical protein JTE90_025064 [Oedothorax gibbosus]
MFHKHPGLLKDIYKGAIERVALYGVGAWGHRTKLKGFCDRLRQVQRICGLVLLDPTAQCPQMQPKYSWDYAPGLCGQGGMV